MDWLDRYIDELHLIDDHSICNNKFPGYKPNKERFQFNMQADVAASRRLAEEQVIVHSHYHERMMEEYDSDDSSVTEKKKNSDEDIASDPFIDAETSWTESSDTWSGV